MKKMRVGGLVAVFAAAVSVQAATWQVSMDVLDAQGLTGVASLSNALEKVASGDTIVIGPGTYDLSEMPPVDCGSYALCSIVAFSVNNGVLSADQSAVHLRGQNTKPWYEKTPEEETVLLGTGAATIFYGHANGGRQSSAAHLTFENGKWAKSGSRTQYGGGAISFAVTQQCDLKNMRGAASNCVFRSCSSDTYGGGTYCCDVTDCLYTNCTATTGGGGAYGDTKNNNDPNVNHTNVFVRCVFRDCSAPTGGGLYAAKTESLRDCSFEGCRSTSGPGGGFWSTTPMRDVSGCSFRDCWASSDGGGARVSGNLELLTNCTFVSCGSTGGGNGGAVNTRNGAKDDKLGRVVDCSFTGCVAGFGGGALFADHMGDVIRCAFTNNVALSSGGAVYSGDEIGRVEDSTFVSNVARSSAKGGALCAQGAAPRLAGCEFANNTADGEGGAVYLGGALPEISACVFRDNTATNNGGGLVVGGAVTTLSNSVFCGNVAYNPDGASGGAVLVKQAVEAIEGCVFSNNTARTEGGAVRLNDGVTRLANCSFVGNAATGSNGGALGAKTRIGDVTNCIFACNAAGNHGGALSTETHVGSLADSTFVSNVAAAAGGAIRAMGTVMSADRCTFSDNAATSGAGGVNMAVISGVFTDCVFHSNTNKETLYGAHVPRALKMVRCRFSGYGDVCARDYDSCVFSNCVYRYTDPNYGADAHGFITYPYAIGNGTIRNCLVQNCLVSRIIATEGVTVSVENSTFADNRVEDLPPEGMSTHAIMFFAFRANDTTMSTNRFVNCIFADNTQSGKKGVIDAYFQGTSRTTSDGVTRAACTQVSNCIYRTSYESSSSGATELYNFNKGDPKFVKGNAKFAGRYPAYMICRDSAAADKGLLLGWHADGKDLLGNPRTHGTAVDLGAYESILPVAYVGDADFETLEEAIAAAGATNRIGLYGDARLDNWEDVAAERYFLETNGHTVTAPSGADVQFAQDTLSVKVSDIYEPAGDFNVMGGDVEGFIEALKAAKAKSSDAKPAVVVLAPGVYDLSNLPDADYGSVLTSTNKDAFGNASVIFTYRLALKGMCKTAWAERPPERETLLRNNGGMRILYGYSGTGRASEFHNLSFEGGEATGATASNDGGAIVFGSSSAGGFAKNCVFRDCSAGRYGGATSCLTAYDCLYSNCTASAWGGGAYGQATNDSSGHNTNFFENCTFVGCSASNGGGVGGTDLRWITGCTFTNNTSVGNGGAVYVHNVQSVSNSTFACNKATGSGVGGFYLENLGGTFADCVFDSNTNSPGAAKGSHLCKGRNVRNCTFAGYGDVLVRNLENCTFSGCVFPYDSTGRGLLTHDSSTDSGVVRNCLFANCTASRLCTTTNGKWCEFDNCTFADNALLQGASSTCGYLFYAFRDTNLPSTNYISNCVFANNDGGVDTPEVKQCDVTCYGTGTSVPVPAANLFSNCAYEKGIYKDTGAKNEENCRKGGMKFAKDDQELTGRYPDYMPKRGSAARRLGAWANWMTGAKDLAGTDMPAAATVDAGCYQCTLPATGMSLLIR